MEDREKNTAVPDGASPPNGTAPAESEAVASAHAIGKAHAAYTPLSLPLYDLVVHGLSNRFAWQCPTSSIVDRYSQDLSANHLEAAVGTGLFLDRAGQAFDRLVLLDINTHCLRIAGRRLRRFAPEIRQANLLEPNLLGPPKRDAVPFDSVALTYVLHCLPGRLPDKFAAVDHLRPLMADEAVLFGATILGKGVQPNGPARALLGLYNRQGVFNNLEDDLGTLTQELTRRFTHVDIEQQGLVALFSAR